MKRKLHKQVISTLYNIDVCHVSIISLNQCLQVICLNGSITSTTGKNVYHAIQLRHGNIHAKSS